MRQAESQGLRRSMRLYRAFLVEQSDPDHFYTVLAEDSVAQVGRWVDLRGVRMLDVGGGPGYFARAFQDAGATYVSVDLDIGEFAGLRGSPALSVAASGEELPFRSGTFDVSFSSNVLEHVRDPRNMLNEMARVTRVGGWLIASYTVWWGPWGGHETSPWHLLGGQRARARYTRKRGREPKNRFGESLFALGVRQGRRIAAEVPGTTLISAAPRYLPPWAAGLAQIPLLGELTTWNLMMVLRRTGQIEGHVV